jgi:acetyltransferase-like isoleucine patch superfamily enzyme
MTHKQTKSLPYKALTERLSDPQTSLLERYKAKVLGDVRLSSLLSYELATFLFANTPGGLGYAFRKWFYRRLFKKVGKGVILGKGLVLRHPKRIMLGDRVAIDDYALLDASGTGKEGMILADDVIISRNCVIQGKTGPVVIGKKTDMGCNTVVSSVSGVFIGESVLISGNCYIGGARYRSDRIDTPMMKQGVYSKGPIVIGDDVLLGAGVIVLDGVRIGKGSILGAGTVVTKDLPDYAVAVGVPATVVQMRNRSEEEPETTSKESLV